jgi:hypothetical protein
MAWPSFGNLNPKSDLAKELWDWTKKQAQKEREAEEAERQAPINSTVQSAVQTWAQQQLAQPQQQGAQMGAGGLSGLSQQSNAYQYFFSSPHSYAGIMRGLGAGSDELVNPAHKALSDQITKLSSAIPAKLSAQRSPDYTTTLTGYRGWAVKNEKLCALGMDKIWKPLKAEQAKCSSGTNKGHRAPSRDCSCGYWSFKDMATLTAALASYTSNVAVVGAVEIWGRMIECENGWRSEFAYPKELWLLKPDLEYLSPAYGVAVRVLEEKKGE